MVKNLPPDAGDTGWEDPLEKEMADHSNILSWDIPGKNRGAWQATVLRVTKSWTPDHLTCLLRNLYAGQEATVRTGHGTTDWFQIGKGVCLGCT